MYHVMLICEDNSPLKDVDRWLSRNGFHVNVSKSLEQANKYYELEDFEILLIDAEQASRDTLNSIQQRPYIIFDQRPSLNAAIDYMAGGADYFIPLPTDSDTVLAHVIDVLEKQKNKSTSANEQQTSGHAEPSIRLFDQLDTADSAPLLGTPESGIIGSSDAMQVLFDELNKVARTDATVLIHGESGTGKELVAKVHT